MVLIHLVLPDSGMGVGTVWTAVLLIRLRVSACRIGEGMGRELRCLSK